jgi:hypothetical protein
VIPAVKTAARDLYIEIRDSDPRAVAYVAGRCYLPAALLALLVEKYKF